MASCPDLRKAFNNFGYLSDSNACFNDTLKHNNAFLDNEMEPIDDSSAIVINARDKYRLFRDSTSNKVSLNTKLIRLLRIIWTGTHMRPMRRWFICQSLGYPELQTNSRNNKYLK